MWEEMERNPALGAPGSNTYTGLIASTTNQSSGAKAAERQAKLLSKEAADLCKAHQPLVLKYAARQAGKGIEFEELKAAGLLGLVLALKKFDPDHGSFGAYAAYWVMGEIAALFKRNDPLDRALSLTVRNKDGSEFQKDVADAPPVITPDLSALSEKDRLIVQARDAGETLAAIGKELGLSKERVRQIEVRARSKVNGTTASECLSDLTKRGDENRHLEKHSRRLHAFFDKAPPRHFYCEPRPSKEIAHHRSHALPLSAMRGHEPLRSPRGIGPVIHAWGRP